MNSVILSEDKTLQELLKEAYYSGKRTMLRGEKGVLVSPEDFDFLEKVENLLKNAGYAGERVILKGKEGNEVGIVPMEDLNLLEKLAP